MNQKKWMNLVAEAMWSRCLTEPYAKVQEEIAELRDAPDREGYGPYEAYDYCYAIPWDLTTIVSVTCYHCARINPIPGYSGAFHYEPPRLTAKIMRHAYKSHARDVTDIHDEVFAIVAGLNSQDLFSNLSVYVPFRGDTDGSLQRSIIEMYLVLATATGPSTAKTQFMTRFGESLHYSNAKRGWIEIENILKGFVTSGKRL